MGRSSRRAYPGASHGVSGRVRGGRRCAATCPTSPRPCGYRARGPPRRRANASSAAVASSVGRIEAARAGSQRSATCTTSRAVPRTSLVVARDRQADLTPAGRPPPRHEAGEPPARRMPIRAAGGSGGGPAAGASVAAADDTVVVGDPEQGDPPPVRHGGRHAHPRAQPEVPHAELQLLEEGRSGRRQPVGHGGAGAVSRRQGERRARPRPLPPRRRPGRGPSRRPGRPRPAVRRRRGSRAGALVRVERRTPAGASPAAAAGRAA